ncbi:hypothetical protein BVX94_01690 [bacterium B17]|nr:hypothetical protein BVX94_01690 [bacterium B17]
MNNENTNPFSSGDPKSRVMVTHGADPYENTLSSLADIDLSSARDKKVLVKPNAGRIATPGEGITTDPRVVAAAIDAFVDAGAIVSVGDSPITGLKSLDALKATGITAEAEKRDCTIIDLDERPAVQVEIPDGKAIQNIQVCADVLEHDIVVSIPVMKMHMHTGVTLAVKNMKGCLWRRSKVELHMLPAVSDNSHKSLDIAIADMSSVLRPNLSIIDGTTGMEGLGPSAGKAKTLNTVVVGTDAFAADAVACALMGVDAKDVPHLKIGAERGYGTIDLDEISTEPDSWKELIDPFEKAPKNLAIEFPNVNILDNQSCSACQSTLLLFLQRHGNELTEYLAEGEVLNIAIGKGHDSVPPGTLCIGNCTARHREGNTFVSGCPPVSSQILKTLQDEKKKS